MLAWLCGNRNRLWSMHDIGTWSASSPLADPRMWRAQLETALHPLGVLFIILWSTFRFLLALKCLTLEKRGEKFEWVGRLLQCTVIFIGQELSDAQGMMSGSLVILKQLRVSLPQVSFCGLNKRPRIMLVDHLVLRLKLNEHSWPFWTNLTWLIKTFNYTLRQAQTVISKMYKTGIRMKREFMFGLNVHHGFSVHWA